MIANWSLVTLQALQDLWKGVIEFIPALIGAIIIFLIGWVISVGVGRLVSEILRRIKFNRLFERGVWREAIEKADLKIDVSGFIGLIVKWVLVIVFLLAAVEILGLKEFSAFLRNVLNYLPNVVVAACIFVVAVIVAQFLGKVVRAGVESIKVGYGHLVETIVRWAIWVFAILAILLQLKVAPALIQILFSGFVAFLAIAGGIAFGLGGKEVASEILRDIYKKLKG